MKKKECRCKYCDSLIVYKQYHGELAQYTYRRLKAIQLYYPNIILDDYCNDTCRIMDFYGDDGGEMFILSENQYTYLCPIP
jgi:DNA-directed RNA polymerase subunit RPC12/RpoP